jgi:Ca-activated chloride channel family protein
MEWQDYNDDERSRFDIAKAEAIRFIEKRDHDALGLVLFAKDTVSRCPITFDKQLLKEVVSELKIGVIDPDGTMLITGIVTAANRLKYSKAKSKIMIVLTDGEPSEGDMDPSIGIDVAKRLGIKIYTVGIGSEQDRLVVDFSRGVRRLLSKVNKELLTSIALQTGGRYFMAHSAHDMRTIYDTIDQLEKTEHDVPVFSVHYDLLYPLVGTIIGLVFFELFISTFVWFAL